MGLHTHITRRQLPVIAPRLPVGHPRRKQACSAFHRGSRRCSSERGGQVCESAPHLLLRDGHVGIAGLLLRDVHHLEVGAGQQPRPACEGVAAWRAEVHLMWGRERAGTVWQRTGA